MSKWPPRKAEVHWVDSMGRRGWQEHKDACKEASELNMGHVSCGFVLAETDQYILISHSIGLSDDHHCDDNIQIPKCAVTKIRRMK